jgi:hypothetical protein
VRGRALHEANGRDERVEHARVLTNARRAAECVVHRIRISAWEIVRMRDADEPQIGGERWTDVRNRLEPIDRAVV